MLNCQTLQLRSYIPMISELDVFDCVTVVIWVIRIWSRLAFILFCFFLPVNYYYYYYYYYYCCCCCYYYYCKVILLLLFKGDTHMHEVAEQKGGREGGLYRSGNFDLQMYVYYTNRGAHVYLAPGGNIPPLLRHCIHAHECEKNNT